MPDKFLLYFLLFGMPVVAVALTWFGELFYVENESLIRSPARVMESDLYSGFFPLGLILLLVSWSTWGPFLNLHGGVGDVIYQLAFVLIFAPIPLGPFVFRPLARRWVGRRKAPA